MVRRPAIIRRATSRTDSPDINRANTACWLVHQDWRLGDKQAGNREQVPWHFGQEKRGMNNVPRENAIASPRGVLRS